ADAAPKGLKHLVRATDQDVDLVVVAVNPEALRLRVHRNEVFVLLPDHQRALGTENVLLPENLSQVTARYRLPRRAGGLDLGQHQGARDDGNTVRRRQVRPVPVRVEQRGAGLDTVSGPHPGGDLGLAFAAVIGERVAREPAAVILLT